MVEWVLARPFCDLFAIQTPCHDPPYIVFKTGNSQHIRGFDHKTYKKTIPIYTK